MTIDRSVCTVQPTRRQTCLLNLHPRGARMKIAVLGTGMVGQALAGRLAELGHDVVLGTRDPEATRGRTEPDGMGKPPFGDWAGRPPRRRRWPPSPTPPPVPSWSSTPPRRRRPRRARAAGADNLAGKVLIDISNPLDFSAGFPPTLSSRTPTPSASRCSAPSRTPGWSRRSTPSPPSLMVEPEALGAASTRSSSRATTRRQGHRDRAARELRPHRRHRPRRHHHRPGHRDAAPAVAAADGRARHGSFNFKIVR